MTNISKLYSITMCIMSFLLPLVRLFLFSLNFFIRTQLAEFGNAFLSRFSCATVTCALLKGMTIIDSPGVLSGDKHNGRGYDFEKVLAWFAGI